jgi:molybdate transport system substrate-binding protein
MLVGLLLVASAAAGCGADDSSGGESGASSTPTHGTLTVFAADSLAKAFTTLARTYEAAHPGWTVKLNLSGSDKLAAQIHRGVPADVFASARPAYPGRLQREHLLGRTTTFATNTLALIVPASNPAGIATVADLKKGAKVAMADRNGPVGSYTETVLRSLGLSDADLNVVSRDNDVESVLSKVELGEADAGFVYVTAAHSAGHHVKQIPMPAAAGVPAMYSIGIVASSAQTEAAQQWIDLVTGPVGKSVLRSLSFGPPPST